MKKLLSILMFASIFIACNKEDNPKPTNPIDQLPPATQIGANTFGCLLDGEVFKPDNLPNRTNCFYQFLNGEYYFYVSAQKKLANDDLITLALKTQKKQIFQNENYSLFEDKVGKISGNYLKNLDFYSTSISYSGQLKITKLDFTNNIVSGTFFYDVKDSQNIVHQIRDGRFDMRFTQ